MELFFLISANDAGYLKEEMAPVTIKTKKGRYSGTFIFIKVRMSYCDHPDSCIRLSGEKVMDTDEHPRPQTTAADLAKLPPVFQKGGTVNAGNASVPYSAVQFFASCARKISCRMKVFLDYHESTLISLAKLDIALLPFWYWFRKVFMQVNFEDLRQKGMLLYNNSSCQQGICDGAACVILASEAAVKQHNLMPLARVAGYGVSG